MARNRFRLACTMFAGLLLAIGSILIGWVLVQRVWAGLRFDGSIGLWLLLAIIVLIVIFALQSSLAPFVGQNYGAGRMDRVRRAVRLSTNFFLSTGIPSSRRSR